MSSWAVSGCPSSTSRPYLPFRISLIPRTLGPMTSRSTEGRGQRPEGRGHRAGDRVLTLSKLLPLPCWELRNMGLVAFFC